jgi:hypothetical protein
MDNRSSIHADGDYILELQAELGDSCVVAPSGV